MFREYTPDVLYMRFMKDGKIVRVARMGGGICIALYPSENQKFFHAEAFQNIDDHSPRGKIRKSEIKDEIMLKLLEGESLEKILGDYQPFADHYSFCKTGEDDLLKRVNSGVFNICEQEESEVVST